MFKSHMYCMHKTTLSSQSIYSFKSTMKCCAKEIPLKKDECGTVVILTIFGIALTGCYVYFLLVAPLTLDWNCNEQAVPIIIVSYIFYAIYFICFLCAISCFICGCIPKKCICDSMPTWIFLVLVIVHIILLSPKNVF